MILDLKKMGQTWLSNSSNVGLVCFQAQVKVGQSRFPDPSKHGSGTFDYKMYFNYLIVDLETTPDLNYLGLVGFPIGLSISGSVRFWTKINNQTNFFLIFWTEPNRKPVQTD